MSLLLLILGCNESGLNKIIPDDEPGSAILEVTPEELDYGMVELDASVIKTVTIASVGGSAVRVTDLVMTGSSTFTLTATDTDALLAPGESMEVLVSYSPASAADAGSLIVVNDSSEAEVTIPFTGAGPFPAIDVDPSALWFLTEEGEAVSEAITVRSVGTTALEVSTMVIDGEMFTADAVLPMSLAPGEEETFTVTWTPGGAESATGQLWLQTNTAANAVMVPLSGSTVVPCLGLGQAWDLGLLEVETTAMSNIQVHNRSDEEDVCMDGWYVYLADASQDAGGGGPGVYESTAFPLGPVLAPGESITFNYGDAGDDQWWCMERSQYTDAHQPYDFTGAHVPEPLLGWMAAGDQDSVWAFMDEHPVMVVGRDTNYVVLDQAGDSASVTVRAWNMGEREGVVEVQESVPSGFTASGFSAEPDWSAPGSDGAMVYGWSVTLDDRITGGSHDDTIYDTFLVSYTLTANTCGGQTIAEPVVGEWVDASGDTHVSSGNPLVVDCGG